MQSYKHKTTRPLIPSKEEAGMESANEKVAGHDKAEYPLNPVVTRGRDPELYWLQKYGPEENQETSNSTSARSTAWSISAPNCSSTNSTAP